MVPAPHLRDGPLICLDVFPTEVRQQLDIRVMLAQPVAEPPETNSVSDNALLDTDWFDISQEAFEGGNNLRTRTPPVEFRPMGGAHPQRLAPEQIHCRKHHPNTRYTLGSNPL